MKKVAVLAFILCLVSMIVSGSSAEPLLEDGESRFLHAQILVDDQLWMIDEYSQTILRMDINGNLLEKYSSIEDIVDTDGYDRYRAALCLLDHDGCVFAIKATMRRDLQAKQTALESVQLFKIYDKNTVVNEPIIALDWSSAQLCDAGNTYSAGIEDAILLDDSLHIVFSGLDDNYQLFSIETGKRREISLNQRVLCLSKSTANQVVAAAMNDAGQIEIWKLENGQWKKLTVLPNEITYLRALTFANDTSYFIHGDTLCSIDSSNAFHRIMSVPRDISRGMIRNDMFYALGPGNIHRFSLTGQQIDRKLVIYKAQGDQDAIDAFRMDYPNVVIELAPHMTKEELYTKILSHSSDIDIIGNNSYNLPVFKDMIQKGYYAAISNETLIEFAQNCYPSVQQVLFVDDQLVGIPVWSIPSLQPGVQQELWKSLDLNQPLPGTWIELLRFINETWPSIQDDHPEISVICREDYELLFIEMLDDYLYYRSKQPVDPGYDTDIFRATMQAYLAINPDDLLEAQYDDTQTLFTAQYQLTPEDGYSIDYAYLPIGYTEEYASKALMSLGLMTINPDSPNRELSEKYLEYLVTRMDPVSRVTLQTGQNEPIENPGWASMKAQLEAELFEVQSTVDAIQDPAEKTAWRNELNTLQEQLDTLDMYRWLISPESIDTYRNAVQDQFILWDDALNEREDEFRSELIDNVYARTMDVDRLITKLNQLYYLRVLEDAQ